MGKFAPFRGPARLKEYQRQLISMGLGAIPIAGPILSGGYTALRGGNALVKFFQDKFGGTGAAIPYSGDNNLFGAPVPAGSEVPATPPPMYGPESPAAEPYKPKASSSGARNPGLLMNNTTYNSWRAPFSPTYQQMAFPGSAIGPLSGATAPYGTSGPRPGAFLMGSNMGPPAWANAYSNFIKARNIA